MTTQNMTEDEAIAYLRTFNAWRCGDESEEAPTPSTVTEAIRTVCDALEGAEAKQVHNRTVIAQLEDYVARLEGARRAVPVAEGFVVLNVEELRNLTFSFDGRKRMEAMIAASQQAAKGEGT